MRQMLISSPFSRARVAALAALALTIAVPAGARAADATPSGCPEQPATQVFLPWMDPAWYVLAPNGGVEQGGAGWALLAGATVQAGNEAYGVGGADDRRSLGLPTGAVATTPPMCIAFEHPTIRFFARNAGAADSLLEVSVAYRDSAGEPQALPIGMVTGAAAWGPTQPLPVTVNLLALVGDRKAAFRFAPADDRGDWSIDDVYVDPYGKG